MCPYRESHTPDNAVATLGLGLLNALRDRASEIYGSRDANISVQQVHYSLLRNMTSEDIEGLAAAWEAANSLYGVTWHRNRLDKALASAASVVASDYSDINNMELPDAQH